MNHKAVHPALFALLLVFLGLLWVAQNSALLPHIDVGLGILTPPEEITCSPWRQVNDGAFGLKGGSRPGLDTVHRHQGEESFELTLFKDRLYVGMEARNELGARLWRTKSTVGPPNTQADWEEVIADKDNQPWGIEFTKQADHIDSLAEFNGMLYASSANSGNPTGTRIFKSSTGDAGSWDDALGSIGPGFGNIHNENFKDMLVFEGSLCGGTWNTKDGAEVWCTQDGSSWQKKNTSGFGDPRNSIIWSGEVFNNSLYFGVQHQAAEALDAARIYRAHALEDLPRWDLVFEGPPGSTAAIVLGSDGNRNLLAATFSRDGIQIWRSATGDPGSWSLGSRAGMSGNRANTGTNTDGAVLYNNQLHVAVSNPLTGFRVWRLEQNGIWRVIGAVENYNPNDVAAQLAVYKDELYAWTTNYATGQAVIKTDCRPSMPDPTYRPRLTLLLTTVLLVVFGGAQFYAANKRV